jgi:hypothetical protein
MVLVETIAVCRWNADTPDAVILDAAFDLSGYGYFERSKFVSGNLG